MTPTREQRLEKYRSLPPEKQELYGGEKVGAILHDIFEKHQLRESLYDMYINAFGDTVLGFEKEEGLAQLFQSRLNIPEYTAQEIASEIGTKLLGKAPAEQSVPAPTLDTANVHDLEKAPTSEKRPGQHTLEVPPPEHHAQPEIPRYAKPLTDTPRYGRDPYREPIDNDLNTQR